MADSHATLTRCGKPLDCHNPVVRIVSTRPEAEVQAVGRPAELARSSDARYDLEPPHGHVLTRH